MKNWLPAILLGAVALPVSANELKIIDEIEPLALNGKEMSASDFHSRQVINLKEGENQLLFGLDQIVVEDGRRNKLVFPSVVMRFESSQEPLTLSYPVFRQIDQAKKFRQTLDFSLVDKNGSPVDYQVDLIQVKGFSSFKNYEAAIEEYNQTGAIASLSSQAHGSDNHTTQAVAASTIDSASTSEVKTTASADLQSEFLKMTPQQRQEFISWAVKHLNE
ncbi:YccT family protein [Vibrio coralliilyticus]